MVKFRYVIFICFCLIILMITSCEKTVEKGEFKNLKIGDSKREVINVLTRDKNIDSVQPALVEEVSIDASSLSKFDLLEKSSGLVLRGPNFSAEISFTNDKVDNVKLAPINNNENYGIVSGQRKTEALKIIKKVIEAEKKFYVFNVIPGIRWVILNEDISNEDVSYLSQYSVWAYHENDTHSRTLLEFSENRLSKIKYSWSPVELP